MKSSLTIFLIFLLPVNLFGAILNVPDEYATIQLALESAGQCDTILLNSGIYSGNGFKDFHLDNRCISIISAYGSENTIIILEGDRFLYVTDSLLTGNEYVYVEGITFTGGSAVMEYGSYARIDIKRCDFYSCGFAVLDESFGGIGLIDSCTFAGNSAGVRTYGYGITREPDLTISNSLFIGNSTAFNSSFDRHIKILGNIFAYNTTAMNLYSSYNFQVKNNMVYGNYFGIDDDLWTTVIDFSCNNFYNNVHNFFNFIPGEIGVNGNISENPLFCDTTLAVTTVFPNSPLLPENNECGVNIGNVEIGCLCGDINGDGTGPNIADLTYLVDYLFQGGPIPPSVEAADIDGMGGVNVADLTYLIDYLFRGGAPPACS